MSLYNEINNILEKDKQFEKGLISRKTINPDTMDSIGLFYDGEKFGVGVNICVVHEMGDQDFIGDSIDYYNSYDKAVRAFNNADGVIDEAENKPIPREAGVIDPERRAELVKRLRKYWPRCPQAWIDSRTDDYIEEVVKGYEKKAAQKEALAKETPEEKKAREDAARKAEFIKKFNAYREKGE